MGSSSAPLLVKILICSVCMVLLNMNGSKGCLEKERLGLLEIKDYFGSSDYGHIEVLPSWVDDKGANCCGWERVHCNTKRVTHLILEDLPALIQTPMNFSLLLPFEQLQFLDFSAVYFNGSLGIEG
ncbi:receptor-like protein 14 [Abrus precatorius]|uniref:Receptor-like protein 14 n=1 Tax=Abrus precatorius TaxID=3816 RepID=A0A8B8KH04_ABRPR|nr:receptor-like protein 14 [Abrus precatorius]